MKQEHTFICTACERSFQANPDAEQVFCVHCGTRQDIRRSVEESGAQRMRCWYSDYVRMTDAEQRRLHIENSLQTAEAEGLDVGQLQIVRNLWAVRFRKSPLKEMLWADTWLGNLQNWLNDSETNLKRGVKELDRFFADGKLLKAVGVSSLQPVSADPAMLALYCELTALIYLYTALCMQDKNYGAILLGIGRKKDAAIAAKISDEFIRMQLNLLQPSQALKPGYQILIQSLLNGYRMYFDKNLELETELL